ncbi:hypothetical protein [Stenotrophomonas mori]|uniref:Uncharacterized protein n=1 Tax=Stenotrophomonas mori TaxID=2871096 RepID=A0ABT0SHB3_9GAMM|nr:hypothetical protein [Stenotrophomonas mori]MCL7714448.1 hypothetical protein [Stenotrophomonas mori]
MALAAIEHFAHEFSRLPLRVEAGGYRISIPMGKFEISISQNERYEKYISCTLDFEDGCSFQFETIRAAICGEGVRRLGGGLPIGKGDQVTLQWNSKYAKEIIYFLTKNIDSLAGFPPSWFIGACEIERDFVGSMFPDVAEKELQRKMLIWNKWNKSK